MQVTTRRLIVVSAIAFCGGVAGLALGNFVAGPDSVRTRGMNETIGFDAGFDATGQNVADSSGLSARAGPSSYTCKGCDAHLHNDMVVVDAGLADVAPLPPYRTQDAVVPAASPAPRRDIAGAASPRPSGLTAPPLLVVDRPITTPEEKPKADQRAGLPAD